MKHIPTYLMAAATLCLAGACSDQDNIVTGENNVSEPEAVTFGAYVNRNITRGGYTGEINDNTTLQNSEAGFGVFGYYTDNVLYGQDAQPNFMYNTHLTYGTSGWEYSPLKFWPNEYGSDASTGDIDRLTFFAYAPYVEVKPVNGLLADSYADSDAAHSTTTGITRLSRSTDKGDPQVHYVASFIPDKCVDLMWGVANQSSFESATGAATQELTPGKPFVDLYKTTVANKVTFNFQHALAQLNVTVDTKVNGDTQADVNEKTHIYVRKVTFEGFNTEGTLNLNNVTANTPLWLNYTGNATLPVGSVTVYDQRRDGREAAAEDANELPAGLNSAVIQTSLEGGVTGTTQNLFASTTATAPIYVIPNGASLKVTIVYDVETQDEKILGTVLSDGKAHGSVIENTITKDITFSGNPAAMVAGNKYTVNLHLGMNEVFFDASVSDWSDAGSFEVIEDLSQLKKAIANAPANELTTLVVDAKLIEENTDEVSSYDVEGITLTDAKVFVINTTDNSKTTVDTDTEGNTQTVGAKINIVVNGDLSDVDVVEVVSYEDQQVSVENLNPTYVKITATTRPVTSPSRKQTRAGATPNKDYFDFSLGANCSVKGIAVEAGVKANIYIAGTVTDFVDKDNNASAIFFRLLTNTTSIANLEKDNASVTKYQGIVVRDTLQQALDLNSKSYSVPLSVLAPCELRNVSITLEDNEVAPLTVSNADLTLQNATLTAAGTKGIVDLSANGKNTVILDGVTLTSTNNTAYQPMVTLGKQGTIIFKNAIKMTEPSKQAATMMKFVDSSNKVQWYIQPGQTVNTNEAAINIDGHADALLFWDWNLFVDATKTADPAVSPARRR